MHRDHPPVGVLDRDLAQRQPHPGPVPSLPPQLHRPARVPTTVAGVVDERPVVGMDGTMEQVGVPAEVGEAVAGAALEGRVHVVERRGRRADAVHALLGDLGQPAEVLDAPAQLLLELLALGDVAPGERDAGDRPVLGADRADGHADGDDAAVRTQERRLVVTGHAVERRGQHGLVVGPVTGGRHVGQRTPAQHVGRLAGEPLGSRVPGDDGAVGREADHREVGVLHDGGEQPPRFVAALLGAQHPAVLDGQDRADHDRRERDEEQALRQVEPRDAAMRSDDEVTDGDPRQPEAGVGEHDRQDRCPADALRSVRLGGHMTVSVRVCHAARA